MKNFFAFIAIIVIAWILLGYYNKSSDEQYNRPWFTGHQYTNVCSAYGDTCYTLDTESDGESITRVNFSNGGYWVPYDSECSKAAEGQGIDRFCTIQRDNGEEWDIKPL